MPRRSEAVAVAHVRRTWPVRHRWTREIKHFVAEVECPHCGGVHQHGLGEAGDLYGHRVAHCRSDTGSVGYELAPR